MGEKYHTMGIDTETIFVIILALLAETRILLFFVKIDQFRSKPRPTASALGKNLLLLGKCDDQWLTDSLRFCHFGIGLMR